MVAVDADWRWMMTKVLGESTPVARKAYTCNACEWLIEALGAEAFTIAEYRLIVKARRDRWRIHPGQRYIKQFSVDMWGEAYTFRARPEMHELCLKHDLYEDWR